MQVSEAALATLQECREKQFKGCSIQFRTLEVKHHMDFLEQKKGGFVKISNRFFKKRNWVWFRQGLVDTNHCLLASLGVSHPALERVRTVTQEHGLHTKARWWWRYELAVKWLWNGYEMAVKWLWNGCEMALQCPWNGYEGLLSWEGVNEQAHSGHSVSLTLRQPPWKVKSPKP